MSTTAAMLRGEARRDTTAATQRPLPVGGVVPCPNPAGRKTMAV